MSNTDQEHVNEHGQEPEETQEQNQAQEQGQKRRGPVSVIFLIIIIILGIIAFLYYKYRLPNRLMQLGKQNYETQQYDKALRLFRYMGNKKPYDPEPVYYEVLTLSKMPPTYANQEKLYEISQYDDFDEAGNLADRVLADIRAQIDKQAGPNYIDNILFEDSLVRWSHTQPLTYTIVNEAPASPEFAGIVDSAFQEWQRAANGEFTFQKSIENPNIIVHVVYGLPEDLVYTWYNSSAVTVPDIKGNKLNRMDIYVKSADTRGNYFSNERLYWLMLHEIGHALGLGGHSALPEDVMYYDGDKISVDMLPKNISARDLNTLNLLYKMVPDAIDTELSDEVKGSLICHEIVTTYPGENFEIETQRLIQQLKTDTRNVPKWVDLSIRYALKRHYQRANYILERILPLVTYNEVNQFVIYYNMAVNYYRMKDYGLSSRYLVLAEDITIDKETRILDAFIDVKEKRIESAKKKLKELRIDYPKDIEVSLKLAEVYNREKKFKESRQIIEDLIKANPDAVRDRRVIKYRAI